MSLREICKEKTALTEEEITFLEGIAGSLPFMADLMAADIFIDCMSKDGATVVVAAEAKSRWGLSAYSESIAGEIALSANEPAVYRAFDTGMPVRDLKAITQENKAVRQVVVPIHMETGKTIAVLISERDIQQSMRREQKFQELVREKEEHSGTILTPQGTEHAHAAVSMREIHHRVKNNLQTVASILNLQARKTDDAKIRRAFEENTARVLSIASIHDILVHTDDPSGVDLMPLMEKIQRNLQAVFCESHRVMIQVKGDNIRTSPDKATSIALVVNELVSNSLQHGFDPEQNGCIRIMLRAGTLYSSITVEDDGVGFDAAALGNEGLGLAIVQLTVKDKLGGELHFSSSKAGTKTIFDFQA